MTRVNLENRLFSDGRVQKLGALICRNDLSKSDVQHYTAIGILAVLWHETQQEKEEVIELYKLRKFFLDEIIDSLFSCRFLKLENNESLTTVTSSLLSDTEKIIVVGNKEQIKSITEYVEQKSNAGKASAAKRWDAKK